MIAPVVVLGLALVVAQFTPVFAAMGFDPAFASPFNFALLIYMAVYTRREITTLRRESVAAAAEQARIAKGSETRAENAAAEITRVAVKMEVMESRIERVLSQVAITDRSVRDQVALLKLEHGLHDDDTPPQGIPIIRPEDDVR